MVGPEASVPAVQQNNAGSVVGAMEIAHCGIAEGRKTFSFSEEKEEMLVCLCICRQSSFELASSYDSAFRHIQVFFLISGKLFSSFCYLTCHMSCGL